MNANKNESYWLGALVMSVLVMAVLVIAVLAQSAAMLSLHRKVDNISKGDDSGIASKIASSPANKIMPSKPYTNAFSINPLFRFDDDWDPFREMQSMREDIDQMFGNAFNRFHRSDSFGGLLGDYSFSPDINLEEKSDCFLVTVNLPGLEDSKIDIEVEGQTLIISGTVQSETEEHDDKGQLLRQERQSGNFYRSITLPAPVEADKMTTKEKKGVLYITLPKAE